MSPSNLPPGVTGAEDYFEDPDQEQPKRVCDTCKKKLRRYTYQDGALKLCRACAHADTKPS